MLQVDYSNTGRMPVLQVDYSLRLALSHGSHTAYRLDPAGREALNAWVRVIHPTGLVGWARGTGG